MNQSARVQSLTPQKKAEMTAETLAPRLQADAPPSKAIGGSEVSARLAAALRRLPEVEGGWPALSGEQLNAFVCCDGSYLTLHATAFARALDRNAPGSHLHVHLVNPQAEDLDRLRDLRLARTRVSHSQELIDLSARSNDFARTYYASIRFVRQYQLLTESRQPVFSFDADALVRGSLSPLLRTLRDDRYDCAVHTRLRTRKRREKFLVSAFYAAPTAGGYAFVEEVAANIAEVLASGQAAWYMDQLVFYDCYLRHRRANPPLRLYQLPKPLSDWEFSPSSTLWVAKGWRKDASGIFRAHQDRYKTRPEKLARLPKTGRAPRRIGLVLPRLDLPFKTPTSPKALWSLAKGPSDGDRRIRRYWADFADRLSNTLRSKGCDVARFDWPLWRVTEKRVSKLDVDLVVLPHRQSHDFPELSRPTWYYMQQAMPWLFSLDPLGWNASGSHYPCDIAVGDENSGTFERYAERLIGGNTSKYAQPARLSRDELVARGDIPPEPYVFFPCQRPTDLSLRLYSDHDPADVVRALANWSQASGIPVVFKAHPTNPASAASQRQAAQGSNVYWSDASIHDLIPHSTAVYVINSGVGFEAMLHDKPVVTFGRVEYDAASIHGDLTALDRTWQAVQTVAPEPLRRRYRRFVDWYCRHYCVDLSHSDAAETRLSSLADAILAQPEQRVSARPE